MSTWSGSRTGLGTRGLMFLAAAIVSLSLLVGAQAGQEGKQQKKARASAEPTPEQLQPVDSVWQQNGWRAAVPHAFVLRKMVAARQRPDAQARAVFWLKGGVRVPILEQGRDWWKVGWTGKRTGWMRVSDLEPHASFVLIDLRTGRMLRRMAAKGQWGAISDGKYLWSLANTGLTRTSLDSRPRIWSNPVNADRDGSLPFDSVWTPDRQLFVMRSSEEERPGLVATTVGNGSVRELKSPEDGLLLRVDEKGRVLIAHEAEQADHAVLFDISLNRELARAEGEAVATAKSGGVYLIKGRTLARYGPDLQPGQKITLPGDAVTASLSPDEKWIGVSYTTEGRKGELLGRLQIRRADTLQKVVTLQRGRGNGAVWVNAIARGPAGWFVIATDDRDWPRLLRYDAGGRLVRGWRTEGRWTMSSDGSQIYVARSGGLLAVSAETGRARTIAYSWRRPLPQRYLPKSPDRSVPTSLDVSALALSPDGRTLILTEWLNGDPEG